MTLKNTTFETYSKRLESKLLELATQSIDSH